jgi:hypothetical protein
MRPWILASAAVAAFALTAVAAEPDKDKDGFTPLFNGKDLTGWHNVNCASETWSVKNGEIVTTGKPTGYLRTAKQYENFELEFEWMHVEKTKMANSGLFVWGDALPAVGTGYTRSIEVQVLLNYHPADGWATSEGDIFSIWGAKCKPDRPHPKGIERCLPSEKRTKQAGEWNHYKVIGNDGVLKLHVNGKEVSGVSGCTPRKGYMALESEGVECHFRNVKIKELPSTNPKPEEVCPEAAGHVSLLAGLTLDGWKGDVGGWKAGDGMIRSLGKGDITTEVAYAATELVLDYKFPAKSESKLKVTFGPKEYVFAAKDKWSREMIKLEGSTKLPIKISGAEGLELRNVFVKGK